MFDRLQAAVERNGLKRPLVRLALGTALLVPAVGFMSVTGIEGPLSRAVAERAAKQDPVAEAWTLRTLEEARLGLVNAFAETFDIAPTLAEDIHTAAVAADIDPSIAFGLVRAESSFRTAAVSPVGAVGLTQVMPATARWLEPGTTRSDLMDTDTNLRIGFNYLKSLIEKYNGDEALALTAYNRGPGTVDRLLKQGRDPDNGYADKVRTGQSARHVALMNAKFGPRKRSGS